MIQDEYSPYKVIHFQDKLEQIKEGKQPIPIMVDFVPTDACNHNCKFCSYRSERTWMHQEFDTKNKIPYNKVIECFNCFEEIGLNTVEFTGGGEPLVHPDIKKILEEAQKRKFDFALVSNGQALDDEICKLLAAASWIRISVDAATAATHSLIRRIDSNNFQKILKNTETLLSYRKEAIIGIGFVVSKDNYTEIYEAACLFKSLGVDNIRISAAITSEGYNYFCGIKEEGQYLSKKAEELTSENFKVFNLFDDRLSDMFTAKQEYTFCPLKELRCFIGGDSNVYTCCTLAYNKRGSIGSIKNQTFTDLWKSETKKKFFQRHNPVNICKYPCLYEKKNNFINYCIKKNPRHVNFI